jgi:cysteinyl-tRNA synthetase
MKLYNSLTKKKELLNPLEPGVVRMYTCGPTVYDVTHIGHGRKYVMDDVLRRSLTRDNYEVIHVQNITDVGHLVSDGDEGEDKLEKGAKRYGKTVWEVADEYTDLFWQTIDDLNILRPTVSCKATDHISEQIEMIEGLISKGYAYDTPEAVYFEVDKFADYTSLFGQDLAEKQNEREEVQAGDHKKKSYDFVLWFKCVGRFEDHVMRWESPWGVGFPGWHIECSAMSRKYLGDQIDIHTGGEDHLAIHHPNEIAQSEAYTGKKPFAQIWVHHTFLMVDGKKMSKSLGNLFALEDVVERGHSAMGLRYYYLLTHYRKQMNFTWEGLEAAEVGWRRLRASLETDSGGMMMDAEKYVQDFDRALFDDLNTSEALAVLWRVAKSDLRYERKREVMLDMMETLGLRLVEVQIPEKVKNLAASRWMAKENKDYAQADELRLRIEQEGWRMEDKADSYELKQK